MVSLDTTPTPLYALRIVVFAKAPQEGLAKTRLAPQLGFEGAARLARRMLDDTLMQCLAADIGVVELCVTPFDLPYWQSLGLDPRIQFSAQGEGNLGERMGRACERVTRSGESILLIGTDCPERNALYLQQMAEQLKIVDAVIAPASDGGYLAIGMRRFDASIFEGIVWSTSSVCSATLERLARLTWSFATTEPLHDIDEPEDLQFVPQAWLEDLR